MVQALFISRMKTSDINFSKISSDRFIISSSYTWTHGYWLMASIRNSPNSGLYALNIRTSQIELFLPGSRLQYLMRALVARCSRGKRGVPSFFQSLEGEYCGRLKGVSAPTLTDLPWRLLVSFTSNIPITTAVRNDGTYVSISVSILTMLRPSAPCNRCRMMVRRGKPRASECSDFG
jgi:hypothetical protein